jgi:flavin reductase (DIM6/NTAB) family NADH-FMN oxidoreductase RutF
MNQTSASLPYGESEIEKFDIPTAPSSRVRPPRVAAAPVSFECRLDRIVRVGEGPLAGNVVFGTIVLAHVDESILGADGRIDPHKLDTIGRMGGDLYARTTDRFALDRPS